MSSAVRYTPHYTVADYQQWEGDWELWSGIPVAMTPSPFGPHQAAAARLLRILGNELEAAGCHCHVLPEIDWVVSDDTVVRPDLVIVCGSVPERHLQEAPVLIAEVLSPSTEQKDRGAKRALYEQQGVDYYVMVHPQTKEITVQRRSGAGVYESLDPSVPVDLRLGPTCQLRVDLRKLFEPAAPESPTLE